MSMSMRFATLFGRVLLGLFFFLPGIMKLQDWFRAQSEMATLNLPNPEVTMPIVVGLEVVGGLALILGFRVRISAVLLMGLLGFLTWYQYDLESVSTALYVEEMDFLLHRLAIFGALLFIFGMGGGPMRLTRERSG